jgi:NDP-sugar pyrophosphorylase family protein
MSAGMLPLALLAGGLSTRLQPLTAGQPKALVEVAGAPFLAHQLRLLRGHGIRKVVICAGHLGEMIERYVRGTEFHIDIRFSYDGDHLLGTAGALRKALPLLGETFFVMYGDSLLPCSFGAVQRAFLASGKQGLMTVFANEGRWDRSNVELRDGEIVAHSKTSQTEAMQHIDYGLGILRAAAVEELVTTVPYDLSMLYQQLLAEGQLAGFEVSERFYEIGSFAGLADTERYLESRKANALR